MKEIIKAKKGRPARKPNLRVLDYIVNEIENNHRTITDILKNDREKVPSLPSYRTLKRWENEFDPVYLVLKRARETLIDYCLDEIYELSKKPIDEEDKSDKLLLAAELSQRKIRIDALKFMVNNLKASEPKVVVESKGPERVIVSYATSVEPIK